MEPEVSFFRVSRGKKKGGEPHNTSKIDIEYIMCSE